MNTHDHHDDDSLPGEDELKALYDSLPRKEPSPSLDQAVRRTAAEAVRPVGRRPRWPVTAASAAVLVLAAGISWHLHEQSTVIRTSSTPRVASDRAPAPTPAASKTNAESSSAATAATAAAPPPVQAATAMAPRAHDTIRSALKPRVLPAAPAAQRAAPAPAPISQDEGVSEYAPLPAPPAPATAQAYPPSPLAKEARGNEDAVRVMSARMMAAPAPAAAPPDPTAANPADTPAQELDKIRLLFAQQRRDEALQRLAAFRQAHPDTPVPDDLQDPQAHHE